MCIRGIRLALYQMYQSHIILNFCSTQKNRLSGPFIEMSSFC